VRAEALDEGDGFSIPDVVKGREDDSTSREMTQSKAVQRPGYSSELYLLVENEYDLTFVKVPVHLVYKEKSSWILQQRP
jgi:hypothetical protein